jgi:hypothetical protein
VVHLIKLFARNHWNLLPQLSSAALPNNRKIVDTAGVPKNSLLKNIDDPYAAQPLHRLQPTVIEFESNPSTP